MNNTSRLEERTWMAHLPHVLWNNTSKLDEKLENAIEKQERVDIIREHVIDGINEENIEFLRHTCNLAFYAALSGTFWYYPHDHQKHLLEAFPAFDPFTLSPVDLLEIQSFENLLEIVNLRKNEFKLAHVDDYKESELVSKVMIAILFQ